MTKATRTDAEIRERVALELRWTPDLDASRIDVSVSDGAVILGGTVDDYSLISRAEHAARKARGVVALAQDIGVHNVAARISDADIARRTVEVLDELDAEDIRATVTSGCVYLTGSVSWDRQRTTAEAEINGLAGIRRIINKVVVDPAKAEEQTRDFVTDVLSSEANAEGHALTVTATGDGHVRLEGTARSSVERDDIITAAGSAPGVTEVQSHLEVVDQPAAQSRH